MDTFELYWKKFADAFRTHEEGGAWVCPMCGHDDFEMTNDYSGERTYECQECKVEWFTKVTEEVRAVRRKVWK